MTKQKQKLCITIIPEEGVPLQGKGSVQWQLMDLLMDQEHPDYIGLLIDGHVDHVELMKEHN